MKNFLQGNLQQFFDDDQEDFTCTITHQIDD